MKEVILYDIDGYPMEWHKGFDCYHLYSNIFGEQILELNFNQDKTQVTRLLLKKRRGLDFFVIYDNDKEIFRGDYL